MVSAMVRLLGAARHLSANGRYAIVRLVLQAQPCLIHRDRHAASGELGEKDQAFALLEKSYTDHTVDMLTLHYDPLDDLRSDASFGELLKRVGVKK